MKKFLLFFFIAVSLNAQYNSNLVTNGSAELGDFSGWIIDNGPHFGNNTYESLGLPAFPDGMYAFFCWEGGGNPVTESISQTIDISAFSADVSTGNVQALLEGFMYKYISEAVSRIKLEQLTAAGAVLVSSQIESNVADSWESDYIFINNLNVSARKLRITLYASLTADYADFAAFDKVTLTLIPFVTCTDGSSFTPVITRGSNSQVLGRFSLISCGGGTNLNAASIKLNGARTGLSNFKLWASADASFGGDTQLGSNVAADPGNGNSVSFSSFTNSIPTSTKYYFLTADVAAGATGTVQAILVSSGNFGISGGTVAGTINNAPLSNSAAPLPVELVSFTANCSDNSVVLNWKTATEVNNYGFELERVRGSEGERVRGSEWEKVGFVKGNGNSNSHKQYSFVDNNPPAGEILYRLKQVDNDGQFKYYEAISLDIAAPKKYSLMQNSPNPFNPSTAIKFQLPESSPVTLKVYNLLGREIATLVDEQKPSGSHIAYWNGRDSNGFSVSSGIYLYKLTAGSFVEIKKMNFMK